MYSQDRNSMRDVFFNAFRKHEDGEDLEPLEMMIASVISQHPEYRGILSNPARNRERDDFPEAGDTNPFFHMGMHITVLEQIGSDNPPGVRACFESLCRRHGNEHDAQHAMIEVLGLWLADSPQDPAAYLARLKDASGLSI